MKQSTKRFISIIVSLLFLTAAVVVYFTFIQSEYQATMLVKAERDKRQDFVDNQTKNIKTIDSLINSYNSGASAQRIVSAAIPVGADNASLIAQVNAVAAANGLQVQSFSVGNAPVASASASSSKASASAAESVRRPLGTITFQVRLAGTYNGIKAFLQGIENNIRVMDVKNISFAPLNKENADAYSVDATISAYYQTTN